MNIVNGVVTPAGIEALKVLMGQFVHRIVQGPVAEGTNGTMKGYVVNGGGWDERFYTIKKKPFIEGICMELSIGDAGFRTVFDEEILKNGFVDCLAPLLPAIFPANLTASPEQVTAAGLPLFLQAIKNVIYGEVLEVPEGTAGAIKRWQTRLGGGWDNGKWYTETQPLLEKFCVELGIMDMGARLALQDAFVNAVNVFFLQSDATGQQMIAEWAIG
ncbi:MAG: hypothetical protein AB8B69_09065 [Chitinophagales bacterium]